MLPENLSLRGCGVAQPVIMIIGFLTNHTRVDQFVKQPIHFLCTEFKVLGNRLLTARELVACQWLEPHRDKAEMAWAELP